MSSSYVDTILIDCNRKGSEDYKTKTGVNTPSIFTCKLGSGIKLNPGDEVSVHSAFVNERGNEDNIELTGRTPKGADTYKVKYTDIIQCRLTDDDEPVLRTKLQNINPAWDGPDIRRGYGKASCLYYQEDGKGVQQTSCFNREREFPVKDNEVNFSISYYKTLNGEGYIQLPRRFDAPNPVRQYDQYGYGGDGPVGGANDYSKMTYGLHPGVVNSVVSNFSGPAYPVEGSPGTKGGNQLPLDKDYWYNLYTAYDGNARIFRNDDWNPFSNWGNGEFQTTQYNTSQIVDDAKRYKNRYLETPATAIPTKALTTGKSVGPDCYFTGRIRTISKVFNKCKADVVWYPEFESPGSDVANGYPDDATLRAIMKANENGMTYKYKQDNSRMTIYVKQTTYWTKGANNTSNTNISPMDGTETTANDVEGKYSCDDLLDAGKDPAVNSEWIRYYEIKNITIDEGYNTPDDIAEQFTDQLNKTQTTIPVRAELWEDGDDTQDISIKQYSECYKPFYSATHYSFGETAHTIWQAYNGTTYGADNQQLIDYMSAYHYIGIKRPDLWDAGRAIYYDTICYPGSGSNQCSTRTYPQIKSTHDITKANAQGVNGSVIVSTIPWNQENVMKYKALFDAQGKYPELFDFDHNIVNGQKTKYSVNDARFLHISIAERSGTFLGDDAYNADNLESTPIFFDYYPEYADIEYSDNAMENGGPIYGIFRKVPVGGGGGVPTIGFMAYNHKLGDYLFPGNVSLSPPINIGWDLHFSAYGTQCCMLYTGNLNATYDGKTLLMTKDNNDIEADQKWHNIYPYIRDTYLGANQIELGVEEKGKFYIHQLHTPEYIGNSFASGATPDNPINPDASDQVYKVNKRLSGDNYCPDMVPYRPITSTDTADVNSGKIEISNFNTNLTPFSIYDAMSGIFIEDFGISQDDWDQSLWGMLGFTYEQFNTRTTFNRQTRLNNLINVNNIGALTTNADITAGDVPTYPRNSYGGAYYNNALPAINFPFFEMLSREYSNVIIPSIPAITERQESVRINADSLPVKMSGAYYLIKSDIVQDTKYYGLGADNSNGYTTGQCLPIVGIVNKENGFGDFYFQTDTKMSFTITKPVVISSITTSIHNPDMSLARVENDTSIIYMVKKTNTGNYNIAGELIQKGQLKI